RPKNILTERSPAIGIIVFRSPGSSKELSDEKQTSRSGGGSASGRVSGPRRWRPCRKCDDRWRDARYRHVAGQQYPARPPPSSSWQQHLPGLRLPGILRALLLRALLL